MKNKKQQGSSLVEVLVALFVLAIGLLGVLAMQTKSMQFNQSAHNFSKAVYVATDITERMKSHGRLLRLRSGNSGHLEYDGQNLVSTAIVNAYTIDIVDDAPTTAALNDCGQAAPCTLEKVAQRDLVAIFDNLSQLPQGDIAIDAVAGQPDVADITIFFVESSGEFDGDPTKRVQQFKRRVRI